MEIQAGLVNECSEIDVHRTSKSIKARKLIRLLALDVGKRVADVLEIKANATFQQARPLAVPVSEKVAVRAFASLMTVGPAECLLLRNRIDRDGVRVMTIKPGPVKTSMTAAMKGSEKFASVDAVAKSIVSAIDAKKDSLYVPFQWQPIMFVIRNIPERVFKKLNL